ncbi:Receptor-type tyrosine- phosphatase F [Paramuricea clavata]|uniref:Receptor-type tyrosine- phosphatase F, partial n=1 Tax=Paramuricea clavata TaxID=317549 RepID=A0A6S7HGF8_PARCT|nr:Receptor-type tyrosine- phosphatase F [Paramuricea clavata]
MAGKLSGPVALATFNEEKIEKTSSHETWIVSSGIEMSGWIGHNSDKILYKITVTRRPKRVNQKDSLLWSKVPSKGPNITSITNITPTSIKIAWEKLSADDENGVITGYEVCYKAPSTPGDVDCNLNKPVTGADTTASVLDNLNEATTYNVATKARTVKGLGPLGPTVSITTLEHDSLVNRDYLTSLWTLHHATAKTSDTK